MKCANCSTILSNENVSRCPVCNALVANESDGNYAVQGTTAKKQYSRVMAWFIAWIGCGLLLPWYIGDTDRFAERMRKIVKALPLCFVLVGFFLIMIYLVYWSLSDQFNCIFGTLMYSDGTKVWR